MKRVLFSLLLVLGLGHVAAEDRGSATVVPQARPRLDPARSTAVVLPAPSAVADAGGVTVLDKFVVTEPGLLYLMRRPRTPTDPQGKFTLKEGGRFLGTDAGPFRVEVGLWTHVEIMADDLAFTEPLMNSRFDFLRIKW